MARQPDFKGEGIAIWINLDKNGQKYLTAEILGNIRLNAFRNIPKVEPSEMVDRISKLLRKEGEDIFDGNL